jgi:hypothetical protein
MRSLTVIVSIGSVLLFAAGPVFAQHVASTPFVRDCPLGEPDSLQISWTAPCDSGTLLLDTEVGCRMWDWHPEPEDKVVWKGACKGALPDGPGEAQWFEHGRPIDRFVGRYRNGAREGEGHYVWNETVRFDGRYAGNVPDGPGVLKIDGDTFAGDWQAGCLVGADGRVVAIGVPRTSCARNWAQSHRLDLERPRPPSKRYASGSLRRVLGIPDERIEDLAQYRASSQQCEAVAESPGRSSLSSRGFTLNDPHLSLQAAVEEHA